MRGLDYEMDREMDWEHTACQTCSKRKKGRCCSVPFLFESIRARTRSSTERRD
jgi:hypothetical protein